MAVEPTEEVDLNRISTPYLKSRFPKGDDLADEERFDYVKHQDKITILISPEDYKMKFIATEPAGNGGVQYFVQPDKTRSGLSETVADPIEEYRTLSEGRRDRVRGTSHPEQ